MIGKQRANLNDIAAKTNLSRSNITEDNKIELIGLRDDVEDAKLLIEQHTAYFGVYKDMDRELQNIEGEYNELTSKGMKSGPMGKKGKGDASISIEFGMLFIF